MRNLKKTLLLLFALMLAQLAYSQKQFVNDHHHYLTLLGNAKDSLYQQILSSFDTYILQHPDDPKPQLERCKFIQHAYYDSYEDYNPNFDLAQGCADSLLKRFPENAEVLLYPSEFLYSDTLVAYLEYLEKSIYDNPEIWKQYEWQLYKQLAEHYRYGDDAKLAVHYGELAIEKNDTLDLTLLLAESYQKLSDKTKAIEVLVSNIDSTDVAWELNRKGSLLLELGVPDKALEAFHMAAKNNSENEDPGALAQAMIDNGLFAEARDYLLKDFKANRWNSTQSLQKLLDYDLHYGSADSAKLTYTRFTSDNFMNDPFGVYRLRLLVKDQWMGWSLADVGRMLMLLLLIIIPFVIPYTWILPIHYFGVYQKQKGKIFESSPSFTWGLRHFWLACSLWLICDILANLIFNYTGLVSTFNSAIYVENVELVSKQAADMSIFFFTASLVFTMAMIKNSDFATFLPKLKANAGSIGVGIGVAFLLRIGLVFYTLILQKFGISFETEASVIASVNDDIISINQFYNPLLGFLFVVVLVPFYEEVLFRGIFLSACERNMKFIFANLLQAFAFALVHQNLKLFLFYFAFGIVAGHFRKKSNGLIISTSMHMMNNLMAFAYILSMK